MSVHETVRRAAAVDACKARFEGKAIRFGTRDCVKLAAHSMRQLGVGTPLLKGVTYRSELQAARLMKELGFADLVEAMDATGLLRIAPSMAWAGDIVAGLGRESGPFRVALSVAHEYGASRTLAFGANGICGVGVPAMDQVIAVWRVA